LERGTILEELAIVEAARDQTAAAAESFALARASYEAAGAPLAAASVLAPLSGVQHLLGDGLAAVRPLLEAGISALDEAGAVGPDADRVRGRLEAAMAAAHARALDLPATRLHAERAIELATSCGDPVTELNALGSLAMVAPFAGEIGETIRLATEVVDRARALHHDDEAARAYRIVASSLSEVFELEAAERWMRDGIALAERAELWNHRCYMTAHLGLILWATGRWDQSDDTADAALREGRGGVTTRVTGLYVRGYVALGRGRHDQALAFLRESLALGERSGDILRISLPLWGLAETALLGGALDEAVTLTERGRRVSEEVSDVALLTPFLVTGARARIASGDTHGADRWTEGLATRIEASGMARLHPAADHARGLVALAAGATGRAAALLRAAIIGWDGARRTWEASWARLDLAACLLRTRRIHEATELLADVRTTAESLGSRPLAEAALELQRIARGRTGYGDPWAPLTAREYEVARLIAGGLTNPQIATELVISVKTVAAHVEHMLAKLDATRRAEIAAWATQVARAVGAGPDAAGAGNEASNGQPG
jgi:DNA-binding CsgD family transcriptional regulator